MIYQIYIGIYMYLINGNKLNGSHLSKCVSDNLVAPLFAFKLGAIVLLQQMDSIALIKLVFFTKVKPWVRCGTYFGYDTWKDNTSHYLSFEGCIVGTWIGGSKRILALTSRNGFAYIWE